MKHLSSIAPEKIFLYYQFHQSIMTESKTSCIGDAYWSWKSAQEITFRPTDRLGSKNLGVSIKTNSTITYKTYI